MRCKVSRSAISGVIDCPPNKSYTHRAVFIASLAGNGSRVENALLSDDTLATIRACESFGAVLDVDGSTVTVQHPINMDARVPDIDAANSGTTIRIAAGIAGLFAQEITLTGDESLQKRPMGPLLDALDEMGAMCASDSRTPPIRVTGRISGGSVSIPGNVSSQFVSALLICAPSTRRGIDLAITGDLVSKPYLDATIATMRKFGASVQTMIPYKRYAVAPQPYVRGTFRVPMDFSSLALLLSAAVLGGNGLEVNGAMGNLPQGDEAFLDILNRLGARTTLGSDSITVDAPEVLGGGRFDLGNSPDLLPALAILALKSSEPIEITNVGHARLKETDRISATCRELRKLGMRIDEREDGLEIACIQSDLHGADLDPEHDHRLFMAFCIAGMFVGDCTVGDPESVAVSYPGFVEEMTRAGAKMAVV